MLLKVLNMLLIKNIELIVKTTYINIIKTDHLKESYDRYSYVKRYKDLSELTKKIRKYEKLRRRKSF